MTTARRWAALGIGIALVLAPVASGDAWAQKPKKPRAAAIAKDIEQMLRSKDPQQVLQGYEKMRLAKADASAAVPTANEVLSRGLPLHIAKVAIQALGAVGIQSSSAILRPYLNHRKPEIRREAARALIKTKGSIARSGLQRALSDSDPGVRATAATGLGALGAKEAVPDLFRALDHKVVEAAASIGQLCSPKQCAAFAKKTGRIAFDVMASGFDQILFRRPSDVPDDDKIRIVGRIRELGTGQAHQFLKDVQDRWPKEGSPRVKKTIDLAVLATEASPGRREGG